MSIFLDRYGQTNTGNVIRSKFDIENDYLDMIWVVLLLFSFVWEKVKKERILQKISSFCFLAPKNVKNVQKIYLNSHFPFKISRKTWSSKQNFPKSWGKLWKYRFSPGKRVFFLKLLEYSTVDKSGIKKRKLLFFLLKVEGKRKLLAPGKYPKSRWLFRYSSFKIFRVFRIFRIFLKF